MYVESLELKNFRNYESLNIAFDSIAAHLPLQGQSGGTDIFEISVFDKVFCRTEQNGRKKSQQSEKLTHLRNLGYYFQYLFDL